MYSHAKRKPKNKFLRRAILLSAMVTFLTFQLGGWVSDQLDLASFVGKMRWFQIREVTFTTEWPVTPEQLRSWIPPLEGKSILFINAGRMVETLESKPWIESVILKKEFPDRVRFDVSTKRAVALLHVGDHLAWLDSKGEVIERATPALLRSLELPVLNHDSRGKWDRVQLLKILTRLSETFAPKYTLSQLSAGTFPFFRVYLDNPRAEIQFSAETWESHLPNLDLLLRSIDTQEVSKAGQLQRINLVFPKKAVVSSPLSH